MMRLRTAVATGAMALLLTACGGADDAPDTATVTATEVVTQAAATPDPEVVTEVVTEEVTVTVTETVTVTPEPEPEPEAEEASLAFESEFGDTGHFTQGTDTEGFSLVVGAPTPATCRYQSFGCDEPETGDRVISVPLTFENVSDTQLEVSSGMFEIEFADGTRLSSNDGAAFDYSADSDLGYSRMIRPGATLSTSLTFEAPEGQFGIVLMSNTYQGEDLHIWSGE